MSFSLGDTVRFKPLTILKRHKPFKSDPRYDFLANIECQVAGVDPFTKRIRIQSLKTDDRRISDLFSRSSSSYFFMVSFNQSCFDLISKFTIPPAVSELLKEQDDIKKQRDVLTEEYQAKLYSFHLKINDIDRIIKSHIGFIP